MDVENWPDDPQAILKQVRDLATDWGDAWEEVPPEVELRQRREVMRSEPGRIDGDAESLLGSVTPPPAQRIGSGAGSKPKRPQVWLDMLEQLRPNIVRDA